MMQLEEANKRAEEAVKRAEEERREKEEAIKRAEEAQSENQRYAMVVEDVKRAAKVEVIEAKKEVRETKLVVLKVKQDRVEEAMAHHQEITEVQELAARTEATAKKEKKHRMIADEMLEDTINELDHTKKRERKLARKNINLKEELGAA